MATDSELLCSYAANGCEAAFREIVERRFGLVYSVALRQVGGDIHLARDIAQRVFSALAQRAATLAKRPAVSGWLYSAARFTAIDVVRAERRRRERETEAQTRSDTMNHEIEPDWARLRPMLDEALSSLNDNDRDLVSVRIFEEHSFSEIGLTLHISEDAARMRFERALEKLRQRLSRRDITSTTAGLMIALSNQVFASVPAGLPSAVAGTALASAKIVVSAGSLAGFLASMPTLKTITVLSGAVAFSALSVGLYEAYEARKHGVAAAGLQSQLENLRYQTNGQVAAQAGRLAANRAEKRAATGGSVAGSSEKTPGDIEVQRMREAYAANQKLTTANVEYQQLLIRAAKASARMEHASFYRKLGLSTNKIVEFEGLVAQRAASEMDITAAARQLGLDPAGLAAAELRRREDQQLQSAARALFGDSAYRQFREHEDLAPVRELVSEVAGAVYHGSNPLTAEQGAFLTGIIARHNPHLRASGDKWRTDGVDWDTTILEAQNVLSSEQVAAWRDVLADVQLSSAAVRRLNAR